MIKDHLIKNNIFTKLCCCRDGDEVSTWRLVCIKPQLIPLFSMISKSWKNSIGNTHIEVSVYPIGSHVIPERDANVAVEIWYPIVHCRQRGVLYVDLILVCMQNKHIPPSRSLCCVIDVWHHLLQLTGRVIDAKRICLIIGPNASRSLVEITGQVIGRNHCWQWYCCHGCWSRGTSTRSKYNVIDGQISGWLCSSRLKWYPVYWCWCLNVNVDGGPKFTTSICVWIFWCSIVPYALDVVSF